MSEQRASAFDPGPWERQARMWSRELARVAEAGCSVELRPEHAAELSRLLFSAEAPGSSVFHMGRGYDAGMTKRDKTLAPGGEGC